MHNIFRDINLSQMSSDHISYLLFSLYSRRQKLPPPPPQMKIIKRSDMMRDSLLCKSL